MATGWNAEPDREAMLRRVAIVLSSLPAHLAKELLGRMGEQTQRAVRRTISTLADVDPLERQRALQAFKVSFQQKPKSSGDGAPSDLAAATHADSWTGSRVVAGNNSSAVSPGSSPQDSPFTFLGDVDDMTLVGLLNSEEAHAVAVVLASIAPHQAARVLPLLNRRVQADAIARIGRLGDIPEAAKVEVANHFRTRLAQRSNTTQATGQRTLDAILAAMSQDNAHSIPLDLGPDSTIDPLRPAAGEFKADASPPASSHSTTPELVHHAERSSDTPGYDALSDRSSAIRQAVRSNDSGSTASSPSSADQAAIDLAHRMRSPDLSGASDLRLAASLPEVFDESVIAESVGEGSVGQTHHPVDSGNPVESGNPVDSGDIDSPFQSTDEIHQHLIRLSPTELCQALGSVDTNSAMLALCGLPNQVTEAALGVLPRAQARQVREKMHALAAINLRDIDDAKERVALASLQKIVPPAAVPMAA